MKFYEFGKNDGSAIFLLPGTCCHWKANFKEVIPLLEQDFRVVCVSYDGFDETEETIFPDMITETEKIEAYIQKNTVGKSTPLTAVLWAGVSWGFWCSVERYRSATLFLEVRILDQETGLSAKFKGWLISKIFHAMYRKGKIPGFMQKKLDKMPEEERRYSVRMLDMFGMNSTRMSFVKRESIRNQFYSDLVTPIETNIFIPGTTVHIFYAVRMGKSYLERYRIHFKNPDIRRYEMRHEELLICYPERCVKEVRKCCGVSK